MTTFGLIVAGAYLIWAWNDSIKKKQKMRDALDNWGLRENELERDRNLQAYYDNNLQKGKYEKSI